MRHGHYAFHRGRPLSVDSVDNHDCQETALVGVRVTRRVSETAAAQSYHRTSRRKYSLALHKFDGRDRPLPVMALYRDPQAVKFVKPDILYRTGLSVREDDGFSASAKAYRLNR